MKETVQANILRDTSELTEQERHLLTEKMNSPEFLKQMKFRNDGTDKIRET